MLRALCLATALILAPATQAAPAKASSVEIARALLPYEQFSLSNGLQVIVSTDRKAPVVSVAVWYHVGSKDERPGLKGFAHLFEHLMFNGSEHFNDEWFRPLEEAGASEVNGDTWFDRTRYYQTVPTTALDRVLWMESDRMGHLLPAIDQKKLDEQRGVVLNEKRQGDNQPYGKMEYSVLAGLFPEGHPYRWSTIGDEADLNAAKVEDVKEWFRSRYGPSNAVLVLTGDIDVATAKPLVQKYFGSFEPGTPLARRKDYVPVRRENTRDVLYDRVPQVKLSRNWAVPGNTSRDTTLLEMASAIIGGGKSSRLYRALVFDRPLATSASLGVQTQEIASVAALDVDVRTGVDPAEAESVAQAVLEKFLKDGPSADELERIKTLTRASLFRSLERVSGKSEVLASGMVYAGDPGHFLKELAWLDAATPADVRDAARRWLGDGRHQVDVLPFGKLAAAGSDADRKTGLPAVATTPELSFPKLQQATLANGIKVVLAERKGAPLVSVAALFDAGFASDPADKPGLSSVTMNMLDEGAAGRDALAIAATAERLGTSLRSGNSLDSSTVSISALTDKLDPSLALMADVVQRPDFAAADLERIRRNQLAAIAQEKADPQSLALRLLPPALYGAGHAYGKPLTGSGTEAALKAITPDALRNHAARWLRPDNVTIYASGGVDMPTLVAALNRHFGNWATPSVQRGEKPSLEGPPAKGVRVALIDKPGAEQSVIFAGRLGSPASAPDYFAQGIANEVLGGAFTSRINMNLREDKHWSYGAFSFMPDARGPRPWLVLAPVQTDKTRESIAELLAEIAAFRSSRGPTADEVQRQIQANTRSLPGSFETVGSLAGTMVSNAALGRAPDFVTTVKAGYEQVTPDSAREAALKEYRTDDLLWVIVGDRAKIEAGVRSLNLGPLSIWDEDGKVIQ